MNKNIISSFIQKKKDIGKTFRAWAINNIPSRLVIYCPSPYKQKRKAPTLSPMTNIL